MECDVSRWKTTTTTLYIKFPTGKAQLYTSGSSFFQISSLSRASQVVLFIAAASTCDMSPNKAHALLSISGIHSLAGLPRLRMYLLVNAPFVPGMKEIALKGCPSALRRILPNSCNCRLSKMLVAKGCPVRLSTSSFVIRDTKDGLMPTKCLKHLFWKPFNCRFSAAFRQRLLNE